MKGAFAYLERCQRRLVSLVQELVRVPTVNPPGTSYRELVELLQDRCRELGLASRVHRVPDEHVRRVTGSPDHPRYNLLARWEVGAPHTIHFNGHYDVVPAAGSWRLGNPFAGGLESGCVHGRGAGDMKGALAALLMAIEAVRESGCRPAVNVACSFTADEETGGELGAGWVVRQGLARADLAVVCEGASGLQVGCGHNGVLWLDVQLCGRAAHASRPQDGANAFEAMASMVGDLQRYKQALAAPRRRYRDVDGRQRRPTACLGGVFAGGSGDKVNTVPAQASFSVDRRLVPGERIEPVEAELRSAVDRVSLAPGLGCSVRRLLAIEPCVVPTDSPGLQAFAGAVRLVRRGATAFRVASGFTDLHYFVNEGGMPGLGYGPRGAQAHGADERVRVRDLVQTAKVYAAFMMRGLYGD